MNISKILKLPQVWWVGFAKAQQAHTYHDETTYTHTHTHTHTGAARGRPMTSFLPLRVAAILVVVRT